MLALKGHLSIIFFDMIFLKLIFLIFLICIFLILPSSAKAPAYLGWAELALFSNYSIEAMKENIVYCI
jgi:hypothetical protein